MTVFPLPAKTFGDFAFGVAAFVAGLQRTLPDTWRGSDATVIKARSVADETLQDVVTWTTESTGARIAQRGWCPRFRMKRSHSVAPEIRPVRLEASRSNLVVIMDGGFGHVMGSTPCEFVGSSPRQHWSSELRFYGDSDADHMYHLPWLNPECDHVANRRLGVQFGPQASRVSRTGLVNYRQGENRDTHIQQIPVSDVVAAVLRNVGYRFVALSSNGLAAERITSQLGGIYTCRLFCHRGVRDVLHYLERGERSLPAREILGRLKKLDRPGPYGTNDMTAIMDALVSKKVLRPRTCVQVRLVWSSRVASRLGVRQGVPV